MTNNKITDARLVQLADKSGPVSELWEEVAMAQELQEYRKAIVVSVDELSDLMEQLRTSTEAAALYKISLNQAENELEEYRNAAPETVPDALRDEIIDLCAGYEIGDVGAQEIWSACRAAMLAEKS